MKKLILNTSKIKAELERLGKTQSWLAKKLKTSRSNVWYMLNMGGVSAAGKIGAVLNIDPKDLITTKG